MFCNKSAAVVAGFIIHDILFFATRQQHINPRVVRTVNDSFLARVQDWAGFSVATCFHAVVPEIHASKLSTRGLDKSENGR